jgi:hypothetical protein
LGAIEQGRPESLEFELGQEQTLASDGQRPVTEEIF